MTSAHAASVTPSVESGNPDCEDLGYDNGFKPSFTNGSATFTFDGSEDLDVDWDGSTLEWSTTRDIQAVLVKGGPDTHVYEYDPAVQSDVDLTPPPRNTKKNYGFSHVEVCYADGAAPECGDGNVDSGEECDDGNTTNGDGCDSDCNDEPECGDGYVDPGEECDDGNTTSGDGCDSDCNDEPECGDGYVDPGEECDDGNTTSGDGCDATCNDEPECGDGYVDPGEECDDGNTTSGDGCDATCNDEPECGDGYVDPGEECDDGNLVNGDGCDATCMSEAVCGDGYVEGDEECDDGNTTSGDGCDAYCNDEPECGDGHVDAGEECDDGNTTSGDGCDAYCNDEGVCGDGHVDAGEECDDGNTTSGDGCDSTCNDEGGCEAYIQFNGCPINLHPYGSQDAVVQYGNTGTSTCKDVTVYCEFDDVLESTVGGSAPFYTVTYGSVGSLETLSFDDNGSGIDLNAGQNYNICIPMEVDEDPGSLTCEILVGDEVHDVATCDFEIIPC